MAKRRMTPKQAAALRKAQEASARKRRGKGKGKLATANRQLGPRGRKKLTVRKALMYYAAGYYGTKGVMAYGSARSRSNKRKREKKMYEEFDRKVRQSVEYDMHLRKMKYGNTTKVKSTRMSPRKGQLALPRGRR